MALVSGEFQQVPITSLNNTSLVPTQDNLLDGLVLGRVVNTALTPNKIDTTKSGVLANYGSLPNTVVSNSASVFSYTSTSASASISWSSFDLFFSDGTTVTISAGSQGSFVVNERDVPDADNTMTASVKINKVHPAFHPSSF